MSPWKSTTKVSPNVGKAEQSRGIAGLFRVYGSVLPRCLIWGILGGSAGGLMKGLGWDQVEYSHTWRHPYALHVFGMVLGFSLVIRIQIAYQRFWEARTHMTAVSGPPEPPA